MTNRSIARIEIENIGPDFARRLIGLNTENFRNVDQKRVNRYAADMVKGNWDLTGDTIKISSGILIDGQHRLLAVIQSGVEITTAVAYDVAESSFHVDKGKPRSFAQWLSYKGYSHANNVASIVKLVLMHDKGFWRHMTFQVDDYSEYEMFAYAEKNRVSVEASAKLASAVSKLVPPSVAGAIIHIGSGRSQHPMGIDMVEWFWNGVISGTNLDKADPPLVLRNRFLLSKSSVSKRLSPPLARWLTTVAWNKAVQEQPIKHLRVATVGPNKTEIPKKILTVESDDGDFLGFLQKR